MKIDGINSGFSPIQPVIKPDAGTATEKAGSKTFSNMFDGAIKEVNQLQNDAEKQVEGIMLGSDDVSPHSAMIALEKADMAFQMMNAIRTKIIRAYEEVIRTQV